MDQARSIGGGMLAEMPLAPFPARDEHGVRPSLDTEPADLVALRRGADKPTLADAHARFGASADGALGSPANRLAAAAKGALTHLPAETRDAVERLVTPANMALLVGGGVVWAASHAVGIGEIADGVAAIGAAAGLSSDAADAARDLGAYASGALGARSEHDLDVAGEHLARAIGVIGVDGISALLLHRAARDVGPHADGVGEAAARVGPAFAAETGGLRIAVPTAPELPTTLEARGVDAPRSSRMSLATHEAAGGHTIKLHVGQTVAELRGRLSDEPGLQAASSFFRHADGEYALSAAGRSPEAKRALRDFAHALDLHQTSVTIDVGRTIGRVLTRRSGALSDTSWVTIVYERSKDGMGHFIKTAYPSTPKR